jgi:hypothetical protein
MDSHLRASAMGNTRASDVKPGFQPGWRGEKPEWWYPVLHATRPTIHDLDPGMPGRGGSPTGTFEYLGDIRTMEGYRGECLSRTSTSVPSTNVSKGRGVWMILSKLAI